MIILSSSLTCYIGVSNSPSQWLMSWIWDKGWLIGSRYLKSRSMFSSFSLNLAHDYVCRFYYQYDPSCLSICMVTVHALLHIADSIVTLGPVWAYWAFPMEHYCGLIRPAIKSRKHPDTSLEWYIIECAQLTQILLVYNFQNEIHMLHPQSLSSLPQNSLSNIENCKIIISCYFVHVLTVAHVHM